MGKMEIYEHPDELADTLTFNEHVFEKQEVDLCCRDLLYSTAPATSPSSTLSALEGMRSHSKGEEAIADWRNRPTDELVDYVLRTLHRPLGVRLLNLETLIDMVIDAHGKELGKLKGEIREAFVSLRAAILLHLLEEEDMLFPWILSGHDRSTVDVVVNDMRRQHRGIAAKLKTVVRMTSNLPRMVGNCAGQQALYATLKELDAEVSDHIFMENNVLFLRVLEE